MQTYETTFIVNPQAEDAAIDAQVNAVVNLIKENGGEIHREDRIGSRRLAYAINNLTQGYYASIYFDGPTTVLPVLERHYRLDEAYIRHLTIKFEGSLESPESRDSGPMNSHRGLDRDSGPSRDRQATAPSPVTKPADKPVAAAPAPEAKVEEKPAKPPVAEPPAPQPEPAAKVEEKPVEPVAEPKPAAPESPDAAKPAETETDDEL